MNDNTIDQDKLQKMILELVRECGVHPSSFEADLVAQMISTSLRLLSEGHDTGQLKLINRSLKEMRYAYRIFNKYKGARCISVFGSARTPEDHPDYLAAKAFSAGMAELGWMCITGAANGIMKAGLEGVKTEQAFGLSIRLPWESTANEHIHGDPKLIIFRYFFTRKLMFMSHSDAMAAFPGGFGTLDELFEMLTLMQTGKANIIPIVLVEGTSGVYWNYWKQYIQKHLLKNGWISKEDLHFFYIASSPQDAIDYIHHFYRRYHSSRYVKDRLVIRLQSPLTDKQIKTLSKKFASLIEVGEIESISALPEEDNHVDLPRIAFHHTRRDFGLLRKMINAINEFEPVIVPNPSI